MNVIKKANDKIKWFDNIGYQKISTSSRIYEIKKAMHGYDIAINTPLLKSLIDQRVLFINDD